MYNDGLTIRVTEDLTKQIHDLAASLTPPTQIAVLLNLNEDALKLELSKHNSKLRNAFLLGIAETTQTIRKNNIDLASAGSPDAIRSCFDSMRSMLNELD
jgi:hypothetical protein